MTVNAGFDFDHVGYVVRDLGACAALLEDLGFTLTPAAPHTRARAGGGTEPAGSVQRSLMLPGGYIEFMQITDPSAGHMLAPAAERRYGLHILAIGCADAGAAHETCRHRSLPITPLMDWSRTGGGEDGHQSLRFRFFGSADWVPADPSYLCWVQHLTPVALRPPASLRHATGAEAITALHYAGGAASAAAWAWKLVDAGAKFLSRGGGAYRLQLGSCTLRIDELVQGNAPVLPMRLQMRMRHAGGLRMAAERLGVPVERTPAGLLLDLRDTLGMQWLCTET